MLSCRWLLRLESLCASPSGTSRAASLSSQSSTRTSATSLWRFSTYFTASASPISENATSATRLKRSCVRPLRSSDKCQDGDQEASDRRDNTRWVRRVWLKGGVACAIEESTIISHREELSEGGTRAELRNLARRKQEMVTLSCGHVLIACPSESALSHRIRYYLSRWCAEHRHELRESFVPAHTVARASGAMGRGHRRLSVSTGRDIKAQ